MYRDTHCHMNMIVKESFDIPLTQEQITAAAYYIREAENCGVTGIINVGTSLVESINCVTLAQRYDNLWASVGIHPNDCTSSWKKDIQELEALCQDAKVVAVGEVGLDRHYPNYDTALQTAVFQAHIELALAHDLPVIIHTRDAQNDVLTILRRYQKGSLRGVIHCFSEDLAFAQEAIDLNFVLGIGGPLTYPKNNQLREIFTQVPLDKIILETDAPFLPPQVIRGKKNTPAQIATIGAYLAKLRNLSEQEVALTTSATAKALFKIT